MRLMVIGLLTADIADTSIDLPLPQTRADVEAAREADSLDAAQAEWLIDLLERPVDLNAADADELENLPNMSPQLAAAIIAARPFAAADDLRRVAVLPADWWAAYQPYVRLGTRRPLQTAARLASFVRPAGLAGGACEWQAVAGDAAAELRLVRPAATPITTAAAPWQAHGGVSYAGSGTQVGLGTLDASLFRPELAHRRGVRLEVWRGDDPMTGKPRTAGAYPGVGWAAEWAIGDMHLETVAAVSRHLSRRNAEPLFGARLAVRGNRLALGLTAAQPLTTTSATTGAVGGFATWTGNRQSLALRVARSEGFALLGHVRAVWQPSKWQQLTWQAQARWPGAAASGLMVRPMPSWTLRGLAATRFFGLRSVAQVSVAKSATRPAPAAAAAEEAAGLAWDDGRPKGPLSPPMWRAQERLHVPLGAHFALTLRGQWHAASGAGGGVALETHWPLGLHGRVFCAAAMPQRRHAEAPLWRVGATAGAALPGGAWLAVRAAHWLGHPMGSSSTRAVMQAETQVAPAVAVGLRLATMHRAMQALDWTAQVYVTGSLAAVPDASRRSAG